MTQIPTVWTAGVLIRVYPTETPGKVRISAQSCGPLELDEQEVLYVIEKAAETMREGQGFGVEPKDQAEATPPG